MKKNIALLMAIVLLMCFTACNSTTKTPESTCWSCGNSISTEVLICDYCGAALKDDQSEPSSTAAPTETTTGSDSTVTTAPSVEETQPSEQPTETQAPAHTHSYSKKVTAATCTQQGYTTYTCACGNTYTADQTAAKGHAYSKNITPATCTQQGYTTYTCACGDTYTADQTAAKGHTFTVRTTPATCTQQGYTTYTCACGEAYNADFVNPSHNYVNNVCTWCGASDANYAAYQAEYTQLTEEYYADIASVQSKIATSQSAIEKSQEAINKARSSLASLSPSCPQWFLQQYVNSGQYGNSYAATQAAQSAWAQQYQSQKAQYENTISANTSKIKTAQTDIELFNLALSIRTTLYNDSVSTLKAKYGIS